MALVFIVDRKRVYLYPWYISDITATKDIAAIAGVNVARTFISIRNDFTSMYYDKESTERIAHVLIGKIFSDDSFFGNVVDEIYARADDLLHFCASVSAHNLVALSDAGLLEIYRGYIEKLRALRTWGWVPVFMDGMTDAYLTNRVMGEFTKHLTPQGKASLAPAYFSTLTSSEKESEVQKEETARLSLLVGITGCTDAALVRAAIIAEDETALKKIPDAYRLLEAHIREFGSLTYAYSGPPMSVRDLLSALAEDIKTGDPARRLVEIESHYRNTAEEKERLLEELAVPERMRFSFKVLSELMYMKDWRKGAYQRSYLLMDPVMAEIGARLGITLKETKYLTLEEITRAFAGEREHFRKAVKERLEHCCSFTENGITTVYEGAACEKMEKLYLPSIDAAGEAPEIRELKGQTAFAGLVRGMARIVLTVEDISKVNEGDILVSSSTNPDLIRAMKKAGAFVTDIGGITSHAAIVSRELRKPCVVGTKIATHVLKDGDMVEVDATHGVVRILQKKP